MLTRPSLAPIAGPLVAAWVTALVASTALAAPRAETLVLTLKIPQISRNQPCGGLCGLRWDDNITASLVLHNKGKRARTLAIKYSCSGLAAQLWLLPPRGKAKALPRPHKIDLSNNRSCRANVLHFVRVTAGAKISETFRFQVPRLKAVSYDVMLQLTVHSKHGKPVKFHSRSHKRLVHR